MLMMMTEMRKGNKANHEVRVDQMGTWWRIHNRDKLHFEVGLFVTDSNDSDRPTSLTGTLFRSLIYHIIPCNIDLRLKRMKSKFMKDTSL